MTEAIKMLLATIALIVLFGGFYYLDHARFCF